MLGEARLPGVSELLDERRGSQGGGRVARAQTVKIEAEIAHALRHGRSIPAALFRLRVGVRAAAESFGLCWAIRCAWPLSPPPRRGVTRARH